MLRRWRRLKHRHGVLLVCGEQIHSREDTHCGETSDRVDYDMWLLDDEQRDLWWLRWLLQQLKLIHHLHGDQHEVHHNGWYNGEVDEIDGKVQLRDPSGGMRGLVQQNILHDFVQQDILHDLVQQGILHDLELELDKDVRKPAQGNLHCEELLRMSELQLEDKQPVELVSYDQNGYILIQQRKPREGSQLKQG